MSVARLVMLGSDTAHGDYVAVEQGRHARWQASHRCEVCGVVDVGVATRRILDMPPSVTSDRKVRVVGQTCEASALTVAGVVLTRHADERVDGGRTRRSAVVS